MNSSSLSRVGFSWQRHHSWNSAAYKRLWITFFVRCSKIYSYVEASVKLVKYFATYQIQNLSEPTWVDVITNEILRLDVLCHHGSDLYLAWIFCEWDFRIRMGYKIQQKMSAHPNKDYKNFTATASRAAEVNTFWLWTDTKLVISSLFRKTGKFKPVWQRLVCEHFLLLLFSLNHAYILLEEIHQVLLQKHGFYF